MHWLNSWGNCFNAKREREREFALSFKHALDKFLRELFQCNERGGERLLFYSYSVPIYSPYHKNSARMMDLALIGACI